jgi:LacI family repressor for deo operon, udp, cdd, tsx, nupC, and nupG
MAISTRELGKLAGLSHVTVFRAMNGSDAVSEKTRRRVLALARKHNYPLPAARTPETPNLLRVLCSLINIEADEMHTEQGFNRRLLAGLQQGAAEVGVELANFGMQGDVWPLVVSRRQVDGVVLPMGDEFAPHPPLPLDVPAVFLFYGPPQADVVTIANFDAGRLLGEHLAELGHRRVAYIGSRSSMSLERLAGLRTALELHKGTVPPELTSIPPRVGAREDVARRLDARGMTQKAGDPGPDGFTALMCYNDYMAAAAIMHLRQHGVRVPEDVSVVGFDNVRPGWYEGPALTTVTMPLEEIGAEAARFLYWRITHPRAPRRRLVLTVPFVAGETTRNAPIEDSHCRLEPVSPADGSSVGERNP